MCSRFRGLVKDTLNNQSLPSIHRPFRKQSTCRFILGTRAQNPSSRNQNKVSTVPLLMFAVYRDEEETLDTRQVKTSLHTNCMTHSEHDNWWLMTLIMTWLSHQKMCLPWRCPAICKLLPELEKNSRKVRSLRIPDPALSGEVQFLAHHWQLKKTQAARNSSVNLQGKYLPAVPLQEKLRWPTNTCNFL